MPEYSVLVEARAPAGEAPIRDPGTAGDLLAAAVERHAGVASVSPRLWSARVTVTAAGVFGALTMAGSVVGEARVAARLPNWPKTRAEATRTDVLAEDNDLARAG